ncbi:MAG TPA: type II toxin-antitoxin system PemK/MazF family toxin [Granulicella sp.]
MHPLRGEVWWVRLDPTVGSEIAKTRPCVVMTTDRLNERRRTVVIVPISTGPKPEPPLSIAVNCGGKAGVAVIDQVRAASKERFGHRMGQLAAAEMAAIEDGLRRVLDLE